MGGQEGNRRAAGSRYSHIKRGKKKFLIDSNVFIDALSDSERGRELFELLIDLEPGRCYVCNVVECEVLRRATKRAKAAFLQLISAMPSAPMTPRTDRLFREMIYDPANNHDKGPADLLIASLAVENGLAVLTANERDFNRIGELDWVGV